MVHQKGTRRRKSEVSDDGECRRRGDGLQCEAFDVRGGVKEVVSGGWGEDRSTGEPESQFGEIRVRVGQARDVYAQVKPGSQLGGLGQLDAALELVYYSSERVVARDTPRVGDELALLVVAVDRRERSGVASEECGVWDPLRAVAARGARDPNQIAAGIRHQKQPLRRRAEMELHEVLSGAGGRAGGDRQLRAAPVERNEASAVGGEDLRREWAIMEQWELQILKCRFSGADAGAGDCG
nr:hypothetical protein Iba_chr07eCG10910 [Ipomoea batatas]